MTSAKLIFQIRPQLTDVVRSYFEVNRALVENETFREAYAMCNR